MKAIFKNRLVAKFDKAIKNAHDMDCEILCFKLESGAENRGLWLG